MKNINELLLSECIDMSSRHTINMWTRWNNFKNTRQCIRSLFVILETVEHNTYWCRI